MLSIRALSLALFLAAIDVVLSVSLNVTVVGAQDGKSRFECWALSEPFISSDQFGIVGTQTTSLGDVANITYNVIPAGFDSGFHTAPTNQWVIVLNGLAVVTLPDNSSASVAASMGEMGLLIFADTADVSKEGHGSVYPGITETIFLQIPMKDDVLPEHQVLHDNAPCSGNEFVGLRGWATSG
ncbi:hypothetical protein F4779DRAFT_631394 [Xylariaceae sp. FL0662B]|nr:hypothetical protein F4779DRAFT_631394 [Xylariaceae sp. FL0662B]